MSYASFSQQNKRPHELKLCANYYLSTAVDEVSLTFYCQQLVHTFAKQFKTPWVHLDELLTGQELVLLRSTVTAPFLPDATVQYQ